MKVIRAATLAKDWTGKTTCNTCHSELEVELTDLSREYGDQRDPYDAVVFTCPVCGKRSLSEPLLQSIPVHLRDQLRRA